MLKLVTSENYVLSATNYKVSKLQKVEQIRMIPKTDELMLLREELIKKYKLKGDDFLLAPGEENRMNVLRVASEAFSHYWKQISDRKIKFYDLRNTYASYMLEIMGEKFQGRVGLHKKLVTTLRKYSNEEKALSEMNGKSIYG